MVAEATAVRGSAVLGDWWLRADEAVDRLF
jgi:hypothetical protein